MKKSLLILGLLILIFSSCKENVPNPAPTTPPVTNPAPTPDPKTQSLESAEIQ